MHFRPLDLNFGDVLSNLRYFQGASKIVREVLENVEEGLRGCSEREVGLVDGEEGIVRIRFQREEEVDIPIVAPQRREKLPTSDDGNRLIPRSANLILVSTGQKSPPHWRNDRNPDQQPDGNLHRSSTKSDQTPNRSNRQRCGEDDCRFDGESRAEDGEGAEPERRE